jgi:hypothetical protein
MAKCALYQEEAKRLYVQEGLGLDTIVGMLGKNVSRKTLYNWKEEFEWDKKRKAFLDQNEDRRTQVIALEQLLFNEVKSNPTSKNIKRWLLLLAAVDKYGTPDSLKVKDDSPERKEQIKRDLPPEALDYIKSLYGLK